MTASDDTYPVELAPPAIDTYQQGNTGIPYMTTLDSGRAGPHLMVNAVTHGNELCGALAVDFLFKTGFRPARGRVTLGFANITAYLRFDAEDPSTSRFVDEDFNRVWDVATLDGPRRSVELDRARRIRPLIDTVDHLLDIHSMQHDTAPLMLAGVTEKSLAAAQRLGVPRLIVRDRGHAAGRRLLDYGAFSDPDLPNTALLVECGQHWERRAYDVALETTLRFLDQHGTLEAGYKATNFAGFTDPPPQRVIEITDAVTIGTTGFRFVRNFKGMEVIPEAGSVLGYDGGKEVRTPYPDCVLIMPSRRLGQGQTAVRLGRFTG
ncbi:MAG TPA: succinylglutamate desuccinylase/aspartoacylase family protein [Stellaceae bacterium]|nr:succinylglutamate desuccinylase/aspartoacylase family protein [Stellaceae bacterium]